MEEKKGKSSIYIVLGLLIALCVIQCVPNKKVIKQDDEAALRGRVQEYWSYKIKGEWDRSYIYETPEYREKVTLESYVRQWRRFPMRWDGFDIIEIWTSGVEGHVKLNTKYRYIIPETQKAAFKKVVEEKWVRKDGQWYRGLPGT